MDPRITMILIAERQAAQIREAEQARMIALMRQSASDQDRRRPGLADRLRQLGATIRSQAPARASVPIDRSVSRRRNPCPETPC
jgi:hypothetical protein